jgi:hypothetical protein
MQRGKPVALPRGEDEPQGESMGLRVKDEGGSERRPVMGRIGVEPMARLLHAKAGPLPSGVGGREPSANRRSKQSRTVGEVATTSAGAACTTEVNSVAGPVAITLRLTPRPMGQPRSGRKRCLMLELYALKGARAVLRGGGAGNSTSLYVRFQPVRHTGTSVVRRAGNLLRRRPLG